MSVDGGSAFPRVDGARDGDLSVIKSEGGMSLRDWFAGRAMQAMSGGTWPDINDTAEIARRAYLMADVMLAERAK